jgi:hypothetical protein
MRSIWKRHSPLVLLWEVCMKYRQDRAVTVAYAPELAENIINTATGDTLMLLPEAYYDAEFLNEALVDLTIPAGEFSGKTRVQLNDAFFQDALSAGFHYLIPVSE